jgi:thiamine pyrophosphokinase
VTHKSGIIFLNGDIPRKTVIKSYISKDIIIIGADGGSNSLIPLDITPNIIIGDMDSIKSVNLKKFQKAGTEVTKISEQETTDFEKCLMYCLKNEILNVIVFGGASPRADHTLNNYSIMKRYYKKLNIKLIDDLFEIFFINKNINFKYKKNELVSILPLPKAANVSTKGLEFPLKNETLEFGTREGTLNSSTSVRVSISFERGALLLFKKHFL